MPTIDDLQPKNFNIEIRGVVLESKPLRLSHALSLNKLGEIFKNPTEMSKAKVSQAEQELDEVIGELIPELKGKQLDLQTTLELLTKLIETISPDDNKELSAAGVEMNADPKAERIG